MVVIGDNKQDSNRQNLSPHHGQKRPERKVDSNNMYLRLAIKTFRLSVCCMLLLAVAGRSPASAGASSWSRSDPLSIPYEIRLQQLEKGNLVCNPSFEQNGPPSGGMDRYEIPPGWEKVGHRVEWVDQEAGAAPDEVHHGRCAVKIHRPQAGEMDAAEGIISDYIPVIPGNYDFFYDVRLKDVAGNRRRLGGRLGDAVTVKLLFFDIERKPLDPSAMNPVSGTPIDTSDKSYSFANYWSLEEFSWATVRARTYNYPFSEGDVPEQTRYVKLFFGLKGTGTMWLDNVVLRYSKWNFSALERLKPYIDRPLSPVESLIPTPKEVQLVREVTYLDPDSVSSSGPVIVLPDDPAPADRSAARLLEKKLNAALSRAKTSVNAPELKVRIVAGDFNVTELSAARLIFSIGRNQLMRKLGTDLPLTPVSGKSQGYVIQPFEAGTCHVVFLTGAAAVGNFYAAATAAQLLAEDRCVYHSAAVTDYPDFWGRSYLLKRWETLSELDRDLEGLEVMSQFKMNKVYAGYEGRTKAWHQPDALFKTGVAAIGQRCRENGVMSLGFMVNPYSHFDFEPSEETLGDSARYTWTHGSAESLETLQRVFRLGLDAGAGTIMLLSDDFVPHEGRNRKNFSLYTPEDRKRFVNLQNAQSYVINRLRTWLDRDYPGTRFEFCPPWYANEFIDRSEGKAEIYLKELGVQIPPDVAIIWTGSTVRSLSLDMADLFRYRNLIGRWPMFWDNTLYARNLENKVYGGYTAHYPGKVRMCNLFEPLDTDRPAGFQEFNDGRHMYVNGTAESEVYRIKYATVADYEWNTSAYIPELSLWKSLVKAYGPTCAKEILFFNEAYYGLYDVCMRMEREAGGREEYGRRGAIWLERLDESLFNLNRQLPTGHALPRELAAYRDRQKSRFAGLAREGSASNRILLSAWTALFQRGQQQ